MNADRRKALSKLQDAYKAKSVELSDFLATWLESVREIGTELESLKDEEKAYKDDMPENLQGGEKYSAAEEAVSALETAIQEVEDKLGEIEPFEDEDLFSSAFDSIEEAKGS